MKSKRSRLALLGVLALALTVTVGLVSGGVADAKKKKKSSKTVTVSKTTPTGIPTAASPTSVWGKVDIPLTVGKKAKGKVVALDTVTVTTSWSTTTNNGFGGINAELIAPSGRTVGLTMPVNDAANTLVEGPTTETPNTPNRLCFPSGSPPPPPCQNPDQVVAPPYAGSIQNQALLAFDGTGAKGTWTLRVTNSSNTETATLNSVTVKISLMNKPV